MDSLNSINSVMLAIYHSNFFSIVKFLLGIYTIVILADIVLLLIQRGLGGDLRDTLLGADVPAEMVTRKNKLLKKWDKISAGMRDENESLWKVSIIEADNIIDDLIKRMGYKGENMGERLSLINPGQIDNIEELRRAHEIRNRIIHEEDFKLDRKQADEIFGYYENFLRYFEVLE